MYTIYILYTYFNLWLVDWSDGLMIAICAMVKCQNMVYFPLKGDGHLPLICSHCKGSQYVMDDHTTYTMFGSSPHLGLNMLDIYWAPQIVIENTWNKTIVLRNHDDKHGSLKPPIFRTRSLGSGGHEKRSWMTGCREGFSRHGWPWQYWIPWGTIGIPPF